MKDNNQNTSHHLLRGIKNFFSQEPLWKLFSLAAALFMWFIVMNTINPTEIKTFTASVSLENLESLTDQGYIVSNFEEFENLNVSVKVEGTRPALDELSKSENKNNIKAKIDLSKIEVNNNDVFPKTYSMVIVPALPSSLYIYNYDIASYYPTICEIQIDKASSKTVPVELNTYGAPVSGYTAEAPVTDVTEVLVTGPESRIANVEKAIATIDITGEKDDVVKSCAMAVYDEDNLPLEGFLTEPENIPVSIEIRKNNTVKIEEPRTIGSLPEHLELLSVDWSPKTINVTSDGDNTVESISLPAIDLTKINKETTKIVDISDMLERANLKAVNNQKKVTITIKVGLTSAEKYIITSGMINVVGLAPDLSVSIPDNVIAEIGGAENIDLNSLMPVLDLSGLNEGKHSVPLKLTLPQNAILKENILLDVTIAKKTTIPDANDSPAETEITTETETTTAHTEHTEISTSHAENSTNEQ